MNIIKGLLSKFSRDNRGAIAVITALSLVPIMAAAGAAIDYSRAFVVKNRLANALDATALAMGASKIEDEGKLQEYGQKFFDANYPADKLGVPGTVKVTFGEGTVKVTGTAKLPTSLMGFVGIKQLGVNAVSEVNREVRAVEVALVLDNTGSMAGSKLSALKTASKALAGQLYGDNDTHPLVKMGIVPFSASVNVGSEYEKSGWIDRQAKSPLHGVNFTKQNGKGRNLFTIYNGMKNTQWEGCIEARSYPMDIKDTKPRKNKPETLWVPYFYPDEPDVGNYYNSYLTDKTNGSAEARQKDISKYSGKTPGFNSNGSNAGPRYNCEIAPITPLTNVKQTVKDGIDKMVANGSTVIPIGMAWGWRVLSPQAPFSEGAKYNDKKKPTTKVIVLMTDGVNFIGDLPNHNKSWYTGYGFVSEQVNTSRLNSIDPVIARDEVDVRLKKVCKNIKKKGILIYTVAFELTDEVTKKLVKNCATDGDKYFDATNEAKLLSAFKDIGKELNELRLIK